jgi:uncharacterized membrane protein YfcA
VILIIVLIMTAAAMLSAIDAITNALTAYLFWSKNCVVKWASCLISIPGC